MPSHQIRYTGAHPVHSLGGYYPAIHSENRDWLKREDGGGDCSSSLLTGQSVH